ncbi:MAG: Flp pilus assembly complex ATPase component TadA [Candidatus Peribacteria bacterium]|nr:Flp pilus assembly complex ATPase component TadA [Candidatus Peribacteria bacterium]
MLEYQNFLHSGIVARFKIMADLKIDESRIPQDGRISTTIEKKSLDLRVSTLPTVH